jgi:Putative transposase DNA-binding domain.
VSERNTSKTCYICETEDESRRVERELYVCEEHDDAFNADANGAENIRLNINEESNSEFAPDLGGNRSTGSG